MAFAIRVARYRVRERAGYASERGVGRDPLVGVFERARQHPHLLRRDAEPLLTERNRRDQHRTFRDEVGGPLDEMADGFELSGHADDGHRVRRLDRHRFDARRGRGCWYGLSANRGNQRADADQPTRGHGGTSVHENHFTAPVGYTLPPRRMATDLCRSLRDGGDESDSRQDARAAVRIARERAEPQRPAALEPAA